MSRTPASQDREWGSGAPVAAGSAQRQPLGVPLQRAVLDGRNGELRFRSYFEPKFVLGGYSPIIRLGMRRQYRKDDAANGCL